MKTFVTCLLVAMLCVVSIDASAEMVFKVIARLLEEQEVGTILRNQRNNSLADLSGKLGTRPLSVQIISFPCSLWQNFAKYYVTASPSGVGAPCGKSWVCHCNYPRWYLPSLDSYFSSFWNIYSLQWRIYIVKVWTSPPVQFSSFLCSFGKFWPNNKPGPPCGLAPPLRNPAFVVCYFIKPVSMWTGGTFLSLEYYTV